MSATPCQHCSAPVPAGNRFCGMCGAPLASGPSTAATSLWAQPDAATAVYPPLHAAAPVVSAPPAPAGPSFWRRYRGPLWTGGIGTVLLLGSVAVGSAILSAVQLDSGTGLLVDLFGPLVEDQVEGTIGVDVIDLGGQGSGALTSMGVVALVISAVLAGIGLVLMVIAAAWAASRGLGGRGPGTVTISAPPVPVQYERPSFAKPSAPTYTAPAPPDQPPPPTFTTRSRPR